MTTRVIGVPTVTGIPALNLSIEYTVPWQGGSQGLSAKTYQATWNYTSLKWIDPNGVELAIPLPRQASNDPGLKGLLLARITAVYGATRTETAIITLAGYETGAGVLDLTVDAAPVVWIAAATLTQLITDTTNAGATANAAATTALTAATNVNAAIGNANTAAGNANTAVANTVQAINSANSAAANTNAAISLSQTSSNQALLAASVSGHVLTPTDLPAGSATGTRLLVESTATVWQKGATVWTDTNFGLVTLAQIGQTVSGIIRQAGHAWVEPVNGNDATGQILKPDRPFRTIDAALRATAALPGFVNIHLSVGRHQNITDEHVRTRSTTTLRDNVRLIGSGRPIPKADRTGLDGLTGTVIDGPLICQRINFQTMDLGVDSGQEVCARLWAGGPQEALALAYYGSPSYLFGEAPRPGHRHVNVSGMCQNPTAAVHAALFENLLNPSVSDVYTYFGTHGTVFKVTGGHATRIYGHGHDGESCIIKASPYAGCGQLSVSQIHCETMLPPGTGAAIGTGVQLHGAEAGVALNHIKVSGIIALGTKYAVDVVGGDGSAGGGFVADCEVTGIIGINNSVAGIRARGKVVRLRVEGQILSSAGGAHGLDMDDPLVDSSRIEAVVTAASGDGLKVGGVRTRILSAVVEMCTGAGIRNSSATTELHVRSLRANTAGDLLGTAVIDGLITPDEAWHFVGTVGEPPFENGYVNYGASNNARFYKSGNVVRIAGLMKGSAVGVAIFHLPAGYRPDTGLRFVVGSNAIGNIQGFALLYIDQSGLVAVDQQTQPGTNFMTLDGVTFRIS